MGETDSRTISPAAWSLAARAVTGRAFAHGVSGGGVRGTVAIGRRLLDGNLHAILKFVESRDGDHIAGVHSLHGRVAAIGGPDRDGLNRGGLIGLHDIYERALGIALDGRRGNQRGILLGIHQKPRVHKLVWEESGIGVFKDGLQFYGAGGGVNLIVQGQQFAGSQLGLLVAIKCVHRHFCRLAQLLLNLGQIVFGHAENYGDRLQLRDHHQSRGAAGGDDISWIYQAQTYAAVNRRFNAGIVEIGGRAGYGALVVLNGTFVLLDGLRWVVQLLFGDGIAIECQLVTVQINARFAEQGFVVSQRAFGLG